MGKNIGILEFSSKTNPYERRFAIVDTDTGEVLDDAQGYGYRTPQKAYAAYGYKTQSKEQRREKYKERQRIEKWLKDHKDFASQMEDVAFMIAKGSCGPNEKFNAKLVKQMLEENGLDVDFSPAALLRVWEKS